MDDAKVELTDAFREMTPLAKWETLVLNGLIGTEEPWIEDMRQALREQEARLAALEVADTRQDRGVPASPSGHPPKGGAASSTASPAKPSVPNA